MKQSGIKSEKAVCLYSSRIDDNRIPHFDYTHIKEIMKMREDEDDEQ